MKLFSASTSATRPITDRVKQALFDVLANYGLPQGRIVADLFCGVGSLGLEALSRQAQFVTFVEKERSVIEVLQRNIAKAGFADCSEVVRADIFNRADAGLRPRPYGLIFVDPPYADSQNVQPSSPLGELLLKLSNRLARGAVVVLRTSKQSDLLDAYGHLKAIEKRVWGTMCVTMFCSQRNE